jgi:AcrR family transcriptional regulator
VTKRTRLPAKDRKALILANARAIFAQSGYEAARTQDIARCSGVSEALMYRHFPSKEALYRAVLREVIREQDASYETLTLQELSGRAVVRNLLAYFTIVVDHNHPHIKEGFRLLLASLVGDTNFATLVYRRAQRLMNHRISAALQNARDAGDIIGREISVANTSLFTEHVGTVLNVLATKIERSPYQGNAEELVRDAVWFCCRGVGFTDEAIERHLRD